MTSISPPVLQNTGPAGGGHQAGGPLSPEKPVGSRPCDTLGYWRPSDTPQANQEETEGWLLPFSLSDAPSPPPPTPVRGRKPRGRLGRGGSPGRPVQRSSRCGGRPPPDPKPDPERVGDTSELLSSFAMIISGITGLLAVVPGDGVGDRDDAGPFKRADTPFSPGVPSSP